MSILKEDINPLWSPDEVIKFIKDNCTLSPSKILFVKKHIREGILPIILKELLLTRIMIKSSCKKYPKDSQTYKILNNRQLGIKLLANVTYGYTSAGFSGRMPSCEISDSIVSLARESLQTAINLVDSHPLWKAKVIYGDTDSIFINLEGRSPEEALKIGKEIAEQVTQSNPEPIKLQFEKVYCPLVMLSKKHYAGYKYEDLNQIIKEEKILESKGIETVRRDTCEVVSKMLEKTLKILFESKDLSRLKNYLYKSFDKIITGRAVIKDFIFAKEVRLGTYRGEILPPSAQIAFDKHVKDPNYFPKYKEREAYLVVNNPNGSKKLKDCIISPNEFFKKKNLYLNTKYYIEKQILPAISRILEPVNVDVFEWYNRYPRPKKNNHNLYYDLNLQKGESLFNGNNSKTINDFFDDLNSKKLEGARINQVSNANKKSYLNLNNENFLTYRQKIENILLVDKDDEREEYIKKTIHKNICSKKSKTYERICRFCSDFDKLNVLEKEVSCKNYLCKIYYEKLLYDFSK
jgi:DNA polymerase elongation subunit (family B)